MKGVATRLWGLLRRRLFALRVHTQLAPPVPRVMLRTSQPPSYNMNKTDHTKPDPGGQKVHKNSRMRAPVREVMHRDPQEHASRQLPARTEKRALIMTYLQRVPESTNWRGTCPHCGQGTFFTCNAQFANEAGSHFLLLCPSCLRSVLVIAKGFDMWTYPSIPPPTIDENLPDHVRADYEEASKCYSAGLHTAAAIMCRRLIELSVKEKGAEGPNLYQKIEHLVKSGLLTPELGRVAHAIRIIGNDGAHPDYPDLVDLTQRDAERALDFVRLYTEYVYTLPAKTAKLEVE